MSQSDLDSSGSSNSSGLSDSDFPDDFPLDVDVYDQVQIDNDSPSPPQANPNDPRRRDFTSLYPLNWLTDALDAQTVAAYPQAGMGRLRTKWQQTFEQNLNGTWDFVEYVPAWSDPDWSSRYNFVQGATADDEIARQYAKPGVLQSQRPALRPEDARLNPTEGAKRWGIYPYQQWANTAGWTSTSSWSGTTPRTPYFPSIPLNIHRPSNARGGRVQTDVTLDDLNQERLGYEQSCQQRGVMSSDEGFRQMLTAMSTDASDPVNADIASAMLAMFEAVSHREEREEYQRLLFGGSTSLELRDKGVWTQDATASTDLATPLHDLVTRDKWVTTESWGGEEDEPRVVYNVSGKQGEYSAHNDTLWIAIQPALQLVSKVLNSQHPAALVWADIRKLRPVTGSRDLGQRSRTNQIRNRHRLRRIFRQWKFSAWPDAPVQSAELTGLAKQFAEFDSICASGFDSTPYVCEILKRTVEWEIRPQYRVDNRTSGNIETPSYGLTEIHSGDNTQPFRITITLAAEIIWPLLVDDYSPAEKASSTLFLANLMLHELAHALVVARCQLFVPGSAGPGQWNAPPWLMLKPEWTNDIQTFNQQNGVDILNLLQTFGMRMRQSSDGEEIQLFWPMDDVYIQNEPLLEEGSATENQYWGGVLETLPAALGVSVNTEGTRFFDDKTMLIALEGWPTDGASGRTHLKRAIPRTAYLRLFSQEWWDSDFKTYGPSALKMDQEDTLPGMLELENMPWASVEQRYGRDARSWMSSVWTRVEDETDNQFLWRYLYLRLSVATATQYCEAFWYTEQKQWGKIDLAIWNDYTAAYTILDELIAAIKAELVDPDPATVWNNSANLLLQFRQHIIQAYEAIRHLLSGLTREASYNQNAAARYILLEEGPAKNRLFTLYAGRLQTRMTSLYLLMAQGLDARLDDFLAASSQIPDLYPWLCSDNYINRMLNWDTVDVKSKLHTVTQYFWVICDVFSDNPNRRQVGVGQLGAIPSGAARTIAQRLERLAMREYSLLNATNPVRRVADEWLAILNNGDLLRNPGPGTAATQANQQLAARVTNINAAVNAHNLAVQNSHPDPATQRQIAGQALMYQQPPLAPGAPRPDRFTSGNQQQAFTSASGYQPYQDPATGFNRFTNVGPQVPALQASGPLSWSPPPGAAAGLTSALDNLEQQIQTTGTALQQMQLPAQTGAPVSLTQAAPPLQNIFGVSAAQRGYAVQQLEGLVGQREATQASIAGGGGAGARASPPGVQDPTQLRNLGWNPQGP